MKRAHHIHAIALTSIAIGIAGLLAVAMQARTCPTEDSTYCYWDATSRGNGSGESFIALWEGATIYLP